MKALTLYTDDQNLKKFAKKIGLNTIALDELPIPPSNTPLLDILDDLPLLAAPNEGKDDEQTIRNIQENNQLEADPAHPPTVQGSNEGRAGGETSGEGSEERKAKS